MTDEKKITSDGSLSYEEFCGHLSAPAGTDLMYRHDVLGRLGLEVLWLKLAVLAELVGVSRNRQINISRCQIKLATATPHLPRFWNFTFEHLAATQDKSAQSVLHELGCCLFRTLLTNAGQTAAEIDAILVSLLATSAGNSTLLIESAVHSPALQSSQLFLVNESSHANTNVIPAELWQRVTQIGLRLVTRIPNFSYSSQAEDALSAVLGRVLTDIEALRARVAAALFLEPPRMEQDLGALLVELVGDPRWLDSLGVAEATPTAVSTPVPPPAPVLAPVAQSDEQYNMESTIIIKRGASMPAAPAVTKPVPTASPARVAPPPPPVVEDNLEATIIISRDKKR
jgi:hypothetical protein